MLDITFYKFNKNENSTKIVNVDGDTFPCVLIEPTDIINPRIALAHANPTEYNYARISVFNRYYFVNNWSWSGGRWVALLNVDVLASFKDEIGRQRQYVVRSAAEYDGSIIDTLYPAKNDPTITVTKAANPFVDSYADGTYIVGIINGDSGAVGCVAYYAFTSAQFRAFSNTLLGTSDWFFDGIEEIGEQLTKAIFNPFQYVASCTWLPVRNVPGGGGGTIRYGWWNMPTAYGSKINGSPIMAETFVQIPKHPQQERGLYVNGTPFTKYQFVWPCVGSFALDANMLIDANTINAYCLIDPVSGSATLEIFTDNDAELINTQVTIGVPIQLAQMATNYANVGGGIIGAIASGAMMNIGGIFSNLADAATSAMPQITTSGKNGGCSAFGFAPFLESTFYTIVDDDVEHRGRPLMQDKILNTIPGYIMCADAELECSCTANELQNIKAYLNGGFYYE